jgi:hypothetical protein
LTHDFDFDFDSPGNPRFPPRKGRPLDGARGCGYRRKTAGAPMRAERAGHRSRRWKAVLVAVACGVAALAFPVSARGARSEAPGSPGELLRVTRDGRRGFRIEYAAELAADAEALATLLTDAAALPRFVPAVAAATATDDGFSIHYHLPWPFGDLREQLRVARAVDGDGAVSVRWTRVAGTLRRHEERWAIEPRGPRVSLRYAARIEPPMVVPLWLVRHAARQAVPRMVRALEHLAIERANTTTEQKEESECPEPRLNENRASVASSERTCA